MAKAQKAAAKSKPAPKAKAAPAAPKPIKEALNKTGLVAHIVEASGVVAKDVRAVLAALEGAVAGSVHKKGVGSFQLPGLLKSAPARHVGAGARTRIHSRHPSAGSKPRHARFGRCLQSRDPYHR